MAKNTIGSRLEEFLKNRFPKAKSLRQQCELFEIPYTTVIGWVNNKTSISSKGCVKLAELDCDLTWLFTGRKKEETKKSPPKAGTGDELNIADLSMMAMELQERLQKTHRQAVNGEITLKEYQSILMVITKSAVKAIQSDKPEKSKKTTA